MLSIVHLQQQLAFDVQTRYTKKIFECASASDLVEPTKAFINEVANLALPEFEVILSQKDMPP